MTTTENSVEDQHAYAQMAARLSDLDAQIEQLKEQRDQVAELLLNSLPEDAKKVDAGDYTISVRAGARRLNTRKIEEQFPATQYPTMYQQKAVLITEEVKRQVSEAFLEEHGLFIVGRPSVSVK